MTALTSTESVNFDRIAMALSFLHDNREDQPSLEEVAAHIGLSPFHFQRLFTQWAGISPKRYLGFLTLEDAKERLAASANLMDASFDVGLSGPSRLHDLFITYEALSPGEYKKKGDGLTITYGFGPTPFGEAILCQTSRGVCGLGFTADMGRDPSLADMASRWPNAIMVRDDLHTAATLSRVFTRQTGTDEPLPLVLMGTNFQVRVWQALLAIPEGAVTTYAAIARHLGSEKAVRAVGTAVGRNPVSYLVPCHRVLRMSGAIAGYHWGLPAKRKILAYEAGQHLSQTGQDLAQAV